MPPVSTVMPVSTVRRAMPACAIKTQTADSDVIAILVGAFFDLISSADIWVAFIVGQLSEITVHRRTEA